jgi:hypothetical protein
MRTECWCAGRPVLQTVAVEVQAWSRSGATQKALRHAKRVSESDWTTCDDGDGANTAHVEAVVDNQEIYETSLHPHREIREFRGRRGASDSIRCLILAADLKARTGRILPQPWFTDADPMLQADLCSDWLGPISFIIENDGLEDDSALSAIDCDAHDNDNVIKFPVSELNEEVVEFGS